MGKGNDEGEFERSGSPKEQEGGNFERSHKKGHEFQELQAKFNSIAINILNSDLKAEQKESLLNVLYDTYSSRVQSPSGKTGLTKKAREFLERVYSKKQKLTREERQLVAEKCKLTPIQVRIWFINKRSRSRDRQLTTNRPSPQPGSPPDKPAP